MQKKYGIDEYGIFLIWISIIVMVIGYFINSSFLNILSMVIIFYALYRSMSMNIVKRRSENMTFVENVINPIKNVFSKKTAKDDGYKYVTCPSCGQKLRIPKNKGKIKVRCPKCKEKFDAKS